MSERAARRKGGGRAGRREARGGAVATAAPFIERKIPYVNILDEEYFLVILPLLGVLEKPLPQPDTIEDDFKAHYGKSSTNSGAPAATPAE